MRDTVFPLPRTVLGLDFFFPLQTFLHLIHSSRNNFVKIFTLLKAHSTSLRPRLSRSLPYRSAHIGP